MTDATHLEPLRLKLPHTSEEDFIERFGPNLAEGGVFVATSRPRPAGTRLSLHFVIADGSTVLRAEGVVVQVVSASAEGRSPGMLVRFTRLDARTKLIVDKVVARRHGLGSIPAPRTPPASVAQPAVDTAAEARKRRRDSVLEAAHTPGKSALVPEPVLGIDLGTTNCRAAVQLEGRVRMLPLEGANTALPSVIAFDGQGRRLLGTRARAQLLIEPRNAIYGAKRLIGRRARSARVQELAAHFPYEVCADQEGDAAVRVQGRVLRAHEIAAILLDEIRGKASEVLGRPVKKAVICVPAYFNDRQRHAVRLAGELAGLDVLRILSEPTAVAVAYGFGKGLARQRLAVYDLGGGTFDAAVLEATGDDFDVIATGGDNFLGGIDFDHRIADDLAQRFQQTTGLALSDDALTRQRIRDAAEVAKIALSDKLETRVHVPWVASRGGAEPVALDLPLDRNRLEQLTADLVARSVEVTRAVLEARQVSPASVNEVILVGGQSQAPAVRQAVETLFGRKASTDVDPHDAVAVGAALLGRAARDHDEGFIGIRLSEVLSAPIGIGISGGRMFKVFDRNTPLPSERTMSLPVPGGVLRLALYQGESAMAEENEYLGALTVEAEVRGELPLVFSLSREGVLSFSAKTADGRQVAVHVATSDAPDAVRKGLLEAAPLPGETQAEEQGLLRGLKKLFKR